MARMLSVQDYGILASLGAITYVFGIFSESLQTIIAKYTVLNAHDDGVIKNLLRKFMRKGRNFATLIFILYLIVSFLIYFFTSIPYMLLAINGLLLYVVFLLPVTRGVMQGKKQFSQLSLSLVIESTLKLTIGTILVFIGWRVYGAIGGLLFGTIIAFILSFIPLRKIFSSKEKQFNSVSVYEYAKPTTFITSIIVVFSTIDVLIAQVIFDSETAGAYAIASILGKIVMWISVPIGKAMFPLSAESQEQPLKNRKIFKTALGIIVILIFSVICFFILFSDKATQIFSGKSIPDVVKILPYLSITFGFIALANVILLYKLSIGRIKGYPILVIFCIIQIFLFLIFSRDILSFTFSFLISSVLLFIGAIFAMNYKKQEILPPTSLKPQ